MNQLKVNQKQTIVTLRSQGWSVRRISRELGYDRETVSKYVRLEEAKPATRPPAPGSKQGSRSRPEGLNRKQNQPPRPPGRTLMLGRQGWPCRECRTIGRSGRRR